MCLKEQWYTKDVYKIKIKKTKFNILELFYESSCL